MSGHTTGLTLGKFAPLHRGHQQLIETALAETDRVMVMVYDCPDITHVPLNVRSQWIRELYPRVEVIEAWDGPLEIGDTPQIKKMHEDYILKRLAGRQVTHFYSSEFYGDHVSAALGAVNRSIDPGRTEWPVSGTLVRDDPFPYRQFIHPRVYRDLVTHVVFLGAPSTGKTTIAQRLAEEFNTVWMPEYGREYWETHHVDRRLTLEQLAEIAEGHWEREEIQLSLANRYLFTDTNAWTTYIFSLYYHGCAHEKLTSYAVKASTRYDLVFLCDSDIPYDDTWDRSGEGNRWEFQRRIVSDLAWRKIPYFVLRGSVDQRVASVKQILSRYHKYGNVLELLRESAMS